MKRRTQFHEWQETHRLQLKEAQARAFDCAICKRRIVPEIHHLRGQLAARSAYQGAAR
jgi:hypothetical protein